MINTQTRLTPRERVERAFARQDIDRIPRFDSFWRDTITRWDKETDGRITTREDALDVLQSDMQCLGWYLPEAFPGMEEVLEQDADTKVVRSGLGAILRYFNDKNGTPQHIGYDCDCVEVWEEKFRPAFINQDIQVNLEEAKRLNAIAQEMDRWTFYPSVESFELIRAMIGDEEFMMAMVEEPEWIQDMSKVLTDHVLRNMDAVLESGVKLDGLWIYGDMAYNSGTFCSPDMYIEQIWPDHKRIADWAHERDLKLIFHTDGDINSVMDLYVEAGFDALQPLEAKANVDITELCPKYGDDLVFFGNIDVMKLAFGFMEEIEEEIRKKFAAGMATKGYIYHSDHTIPPQVSWERYLEIIKLIDRYGQYE